MLHYKNLRSNFWGLVVARATSIINKIPIESLKVTLEESWSAKKPHIRFFKVFGCIDLKYIPTK